MIVNDHRESSYLGVWDIYHPSRTELDCELISSLLASLVSMLGPMPTWIVRMVTELSWDSKWLGPGEGWPLSDVLADVGA